MLAGGIALALAGGYLAFGSLYSDARTGAATAVVAEAGGEDVITRCSLRNIVETSFSTGQSSVLSTDEERITRRGLRTVPQASGPFLGGDLSTKQLAVLLADEDTITRRGQR